MGKNVLRKRCKHCGIETSQLGICNRINCDYAGEITETITDEIYDPLATSKTHKTCPDCKQVFPATDNYFNRGGTGYFDYCWDCKKKYNKEYRQGSSRR